MDTFERWFTQDLNKPILPQHGQGLVFTGDDGTPLVGVHVTRNGAPADLSGAVSCTVIRADGTTVPVTGGTISGGDVSVVLSSACFNIRGPIGVALAVTSGSTTMTVLKAMFQVDITSTGNIIDPSGEITLDVANLIADIDAAVASIPADYSDLLAAIAPTFSASTAYAAGAYVWYNGNLYRFTAAHVAGAWTGTDAAQVPLAGDVADLKSAVDNGILSALYDNLDYTLTIGAGVNPSTGGNYNNQARYARTSNFNLQEKRTIAFAILDPTYEYVVWAYSGASASSATYSPTNSQYVSTWVFIPYTGSDRQFRVGIQRTDHASMTSGDDPSTDESRLKKAIKVVHLPATADMALFTATNEITREFGGTVRPFFRQGSGNFNAGYYVESPNLEMCATPTNALPTLTKGDTITLSDGYSCLFCTIERSGDVILRKKNYGEFTGAYTIQESGIYLLTVKKVNGESINIDEARAAVTIQHNGTTTLCNLPKNPYKHIAKNKIAENNCEWSTLVKDIKSTCHLHTYKALYFTRARLAGYDHIAVSNYHASKPTVPIASIITELNGYTQSRDAVPETWLESPNAEHVYFTDADSYVGASAGSHLHLCSVGSYVTSGADNTSVGEGGFEGTVLDFAKAFEEMRQYSNGGGITINHPVWSGIDKDGILNLLLKVPHIFGMEIYNSNAEHGTGKGYALDLWDEVLATGNQIFGTAVPDHETEGSFWEDHLPLGFIHLLCLTRTEQEIMLAYRNGRFYTTIGNDTLLLRFFGIDDNGLVTFKATDTGTIKFVTAKRTVTVENNNTATFQTQSNDVYVRAEIETATNRLFTNAIML